MFILYFSEFNFEVINCGLFNTHHFSSRVRVDSTSASRTTRQASKELNTTVAANGRDDHVSNFSCHFLLLPFST